MGFFSRHRKAFKSVIASFGMLFGLLAGVSVTANVGYAGLSGTLNDSLASLLNITTSWSGEWSMNDRAIQGDVTGDHFIKDIKYSSTLTIQNKFEKPIELSFNWSVTLPSSKGSVSVDGQSYTSNQTSIFYQKSRLEKKASIKIEISASGKNTTKFQLNDLSAIVIKESTITFKKADFGDYYVNDVLVDDGFQQPGSKPSTTAYTLKAKPDTGYDFIGWQTTIGNTSKIVSIDNPYDFKSADDCEVTAVFKEGQNHAIFSNDSRYFGDLGEAIEHANDSSDNIVRLFKSGNVFPKADGSSYVFSNGVNLFIPGSGASNYDDFAKEESPVQGSNQTRTCSYTLTLSSGVRINVSKGSSICIAGQMWYATGGNLTSLPVGPIGELNLSDGSIITLTSGACFYAWGYASGSGQIHALNGSTVYEGFSFSFRGGSASSEIMKSMFVFNQYYVQNIEAHLYVYAGATEKTYAAVHGAGLDKGTTITFIGTDGMFALNSGYIVKFYDPATDRLSLDVFGDGRLSRIKVSLGGFIFSIDSSKYILPICNNMDICVSSGTVSIEQDLEFLPGSSLTIKSGAVATLGSNRKIFFYDLSNWKDKKYGFINTDIQPISYVSPSAASAFDKAKRTVSTGAVLKLNGEFKNSGGVYMTKPNNDTQKASELGRIISDGGGKFTYVAQEYQYGQDVSEKTSQYNQGTDKVDPISATTAVFINSDDSVFSKTCPKGAALVHENGVWKMQYQEPYNIDITFKNVDGSTLKTQSFKVDPSGSGIVLPDQTEFTAVQGTIFLWLKETDKTVSYEPKKNVDITEPIVLIAFTGGWYTDLNKDIFYYDRSTGKTKGLKYIYEEGTWPEALYCFNENGHLLSGKNQLFSYEQGTKYDGGGDNNLYYVTDGIVQNNVGLTEYDVVVGEVAARYYYYFGPSHYAYRNTTCYINTNLNSLLPEGVYTFDNDGRVEVLECSNFADVDSVTLSADGYCTFGTIKAGIGLFTSGTHIYYAKDDGSIMKGGTYYVEEGKRNGKVTEPGLYYFDTNGYLCDSMMNPITVTPPEANA